jgi:hypothetical protein
MSSSEGGSDRVSTPQAESLLARAAALDAQQTAGGVSVPELRRAALEAGIGAAAFDAAYREAHVTAAAATVTPPWIVRITMIGVPNRVVAWGFYAFFLLLLFGSGAAAVATRFGWSPPLPIETSLSLFVAGFSVFALWSTAKAIRWTEQNGWDQLP